MLQWFRPKSVPRRLARFCLLPVAAALLLSACEMDQSAGPMPEPIRPVRVAEVVKAGGGEEVTLTGTVEAEDNISLAFRVGGQLIDRSVGVGDRVQAGDVVARLDAQTQRNAVDAARAQLAAAMAQLVEARNTIARYEPMLERGFVARQQFDRAVESRDAAEARVEAAEAQLRTAENQLSFTELVADASGTVTARGAEPGEVVAAGQMVLQLAREGGRDAVFDFPPRVKDSLAADTLIEVVSSTDPSSSATGRVREVSPQADRVTRTFEVRVGLANPPAAFRLGSTVIGKVPMGGGAEGLAIPAAALTRADGQPAVWIVDQDTQRVALRDIDVLGYELDAVFVGHGLAPGELVVTAGVQSLRPQQQVRLLGEATTASTWSLIGSVVEAEAEAEDETVEAVSGTDAEEAAEAPREAIAANDVADVETAPSDQPADVDADTDARESVVESEAESRE